MNSIPRKLTLGLLLAVGAAACGDDVTVANLPEVAPAVRSVVVPSAAAIIVTECGILDVAPPVAMIKGAVLASNTVRSPGGSSG